MQANRIDACSKTSAASCLVLMSSGGETGSVDICPNFRLKKFILSRFLVLPAGPSSPYSGERASRTTGSVTSFFSL